MGMYDYIDCKVPLPGTPPRKMRFQTKGTPIQYLATYEIREDGLWCVDPGAFEEKDEKPYRLDDYHGDLYFYMNDTSKPGDEIWYKYRARFTEGNLTSVIQIKENEA